MPSLQVYVDLYASLFRPCRENLLYLTHLLFELIEVCRLVFFLFRLLLNTIYGTRNDTNDKRKIFL